SMGIVDTFVQDLVTWSKARVIRGPHWDDRMAKFIQVLKGEIFDVIVDMRESSTTYKQWEGTILSAENRVQLYVPKGFAHGFLTLAEENIVHYKMSAQHDPAREHRLHWKDPSVAIQWPHMDDVIISEKDDAPP
ncbi:MAG: dTDP-4-dehydrorhamnose 3,5-epimerase, partial [Candidatus Eremiobacteraeota bacterium]|nr:dTDP-4-dehydrorhamnose 3,5-epimerase [Candidatus Eremiobacteraeota bacterium]